MTNIPNYNHHSHGIFKGVPRKYISGHNQSGSPRAEGFAERPSKNMRKCVCGGWRTRSSPQCRACWTKEDKPAVDPFTYIVNGKPRRRIPLTQEQYAWVDAADYERMMRLTYHAQWSPLKRAFYAKRSLTIAINAYIPVPMQYDVMTPEEGEIIDHIDPKDTLNNCIDNLRSASQAENMRNRKRGKNNTSGRKNVRLQNGNYYVRVAVHGETTKFGPFKTFDEACSVQEMAVKAIHGEFANIG